MLQSARSANVVAFLALAVALGGTSYAAITLPRNSVGPKQLKANAVTSAKVKNGSLLKKDFKAAQLPAGAQGPAGAPGAKGDKGDKGETGASAAPLFGDAYSVTGSDFHARNSGTFYTGAGAVTTDDVGGDFVYRFQLPQGATIKRVVVYYGDQEAAKNLAFVLARYKVGTEDADTLSQVVTSGENAPGLLSKELIPPPGMDVVDNTTYSYDVIAVLAGADQSLHGARIEFTTP
jgi:hypothetical protein